MRSSTNDAAVRAVLRRFQEGYSRRESQDLDEFMKLFVLEETLEIIGTSAIDPFHEEWCRGVAATRALIAADWESWGDLALDVAAASIHSRGDAAWLATTGTVSQKISLEHSYAGMGQFLQRFMDRRNDSQTDIEGELLTIIMGAASVLSDRRQGEDHVWPLRFSATLVREGEDWKFHQIHFSYPTVHLPQVRST
jgi:hypothetical protein